MARPDVLPRLPLDLLIDALRRVPADELETVLRERIIPLVNLPGLTLHIACSPLAARRAIADGRRLVAFATPSDFHEALRRTHAQWLLQDATLNLAKNRPEFSAARRMSLVQVLVFVGLLLMFALAALLLPAKIFWSLASLVAAVFFLAIIALRLLCLMPPVPRPQINAPPTDEQDLPVYTVLVPLYREISVLPQLLDALDQLNYPALCIKRTKTE